MCMYVSHVRSSLSFSRGGVKLVGAIDICRLLVKLACCGLNDMWVGMFGCNGRYMTG